MYVCVCICVSVFALKALAIYQDIDIFERSEEGGCKRGGRVPLERKAMMRPLASLYADWYGPAYSKKIFDQLHQTCEQVQHA